jgi:HPt (histidine-containing phosphotransfer) domain-containing protein
LRRRERQKQAEENRGNRELSEQTIADETHKILGKLNGIDLNKQKERERQLEKIQAKLKGNKTVNQKDDQQIANEIIENYQDSKLALVIFLFFKLVANK